MKLTFIILFSFSNLILTAQISHKQWDDLVKKYVTLEGRVNYESFVKDVKYLDGYLALLSNNPPQATWSNDETLAYWINAYNAFTVKLIVEHYPVKSIKDLGGSIYKVNTPWDIKFIDIGNEKLDLNNIEHQKIREQFKEPRIHFAVNCASISCPKLRNEAYIASKLNDQLNDQTTHFLHNKVTNDLSDINNVKLSKLFNWYSSDFKVNGKSVLDFINLYLDKKIPANSNVNYMNYNWNLNN